MQYVIMLLFLFILFMLFFTLIPFLLPVLLILLIVGFYQSYRLRRNVQRQYEEAAREYEQQMKQNGYHQERSGGSAHSDTSDVIDVEYTEETVEDEK